MAKLQQARCHLFECRISKLCIAFFLFLSSCSLAPNYERPLLEYPANWRVSFVSEEQVEKAWWKQFGDESLDLLIARALANNQDLKTLIARVDQFEASLTMARSKYYPQINGQGLASRQKIADTVTALPTGIQQVFNLFGLIFNASYLVDLWGEVRSGAEAAYHAYLSSIEMRRMGVLKLISSVASSYMQLRQYDEQLIISQETLETRKRSLYLASVRFELGLTSKIEVEQAISEVESAQVQVENFEILIAETENLLSVLIGVPSQNIPRGLLLDQEKIALSIPAIMPSELLNQRPDVRAAEEKLIALNANIGVARAKFFPQINLTGAVGTEGVQLSELFTEGAKIWEIGSNAMEQIFTGFNNLGNLGKAKAAREEALHSYLSIVLNAFKEVNDALISHKVYLEMVETEVKRVNALSEYLHLSNLRYREGQIDYLTFLDAERHLFRAQLELEVAKASSLISYIQIYQALGGPWVIEADVKALESN